MTQTVIFRDLPATFPSEPGYRRRAAFGSILVHMGMLATAVIVPILFAANTPDLRLLTFVVPLPPPSGPPLTAAMQPKTEAAAPKMVRSEQRRTEPSLEIPFAIPDEVARVVDAPVLFDESGFGVPGGMPGGETPSWLSRSMPALPLLSNAVSTLDVPVPPLPKVEAPDQVEESPIRLSEFHPLKTVRATPPLYPRAAKMARIQGTVLLELTLSEMGEVEEVRVVSGHQALAQAAVDCVRNWIYEPPRVDGKAVRVLIPVRLNFRLEL